MQLDPIVARHLNEHINAEWAAAYFYASVSAWADQHAFPGLKGWADAASREEREHAQRFTDYLSDRGGAVVLAPLLAPPEAFASYQAALEAAEIAEHAVTDHLCQVADVARAASDHATAQFCVDWVNAEQVKAIKEIADMLVIVRRGAPVDLLDDVLFEGA